MWIPSSAHARFITLFDTQVGRFWLIIWTLLRVLFYRAAGCLLGEGFWNDDVEMIGRESLRKDSWMELAVCGCVRWLLPAR
jgi:hypothetical protein